MVSTQSQTTTNFRGLKVFILEDHLRFKIGRVLYNVSIVRSEGENKTTKQMTRNHLSEIKIIKPTDISKQIIPFLSPLFAMVLICYQDRSSTELPSLLMSLKSLFSTFEVYYYFFFSFFFFNTKCIALKHTVIVFFFHYGLPEQSFNIQFGLQWKKTSLCVRIELLTFTSSHRGHDERSQTGRSPKYLQVARKMVCLNCKRFSRRGMWALVWQLHCLLGIAGELSALTICYSNLFFFLQKML